MRRHPPCHLLINLYGSVQNMRSIRPQIPSASIPYMCNFLPSCSYSREITANGLSNSATLSNSALYSPSLLIAANRLCSLPSQSHCCESSNEPCRDSPGSIIDKVYETIMSHCSSRQMLECELDALGLELTTELVNEVMHRLRYEEKLAFRFFTWAGRQGGYAHEGQTYNIMIEILSSTRYKIRQFGVTCDVLDYMKRKRRNSVPVDALLTILKTYAEKHMSHIGKLAKKKRIKPKIQPEVHSFNLLLDAFCKCSLVIEADAMFHRVKHKVNPNAETYNILFFGWCRVRDPKKAMNVLEEMIDRGLNPESFTYNAALDSFCDSGMIAEARELFEFMRTKGSVISSPTAKTYTVMIVALAKFDMMDECFKLLSDMRCCGCLPDVSTYKDLIEGMCLAGKVVVAYKILEEMGKNGYPPDILTYNCFLNVLCNLKKHEEALWLCEKMIEAGCEPSVHTYNMLIKMFFGLMNADQAFAIWHEMDKRGSEHSVDTYGIMIDGLFHCQRVEDACFLLDEVIDRGMKLSFKSFDTLMLRLSEIGNLHAIHRLSEHMRRFYNVAMARRFSLRQKKKSISMRST